MRKNYTCKCGKINEHPPYVFAHWNDQLIHTCACGRKNELLRGIVVKWGKQLVATAAVLLFAIVASATTAGNLKYDVAVERIVISCLDHKPATVKILNPASGSVVIVDCEREK